MAQSKAADPFCDVTSRVITPHSMAQMQNLLDSLDTTSKSSKNDFLSFFVQSMFQSFLPTDLHDTMRANTQLPLVQNIPTRDGDCCLVKDQWVLPNDEHPNPTSIHHRFACSLELINRRISDWSTVKEFMSALLDVAEAHAKVTTHCNMVHGNITPMNFLVDRNGKGVLTDWDLRK